MLKFKTTEMTDEHTQLLRSLCRACGQRVQRPKKKDPVHESTKHSGILHTLGVDVEHDQPVVHPPSVCNRCYAAALRSSAAAKREVAYHHTITFFK